MVFLFSSFGTFEMKYWDLICLAKLDKSPRLRFIFSFKSFTHFYFIKIPLLLNKTPKKIYQSMIQYYMIGPAKIGLLGSTSRLDGFN